MTVQLAQNGKVLLIGDCSVEDADLLLQHLAQQPTNPVDWTACTSAHTAVIQVLLSAARVPEGEPKSLFLKDFVTSAISRAGGK